MRFKKTNNNQITTLPEDFREIITEAKGSGFDMLRLCRDNSNPALLSDNKPVLDISQDDLVGIFDKKSNHYFLRSDQAFRLGIFSQLSLFETVAFMVKAEWEFFLAEFLNHSETEILDLDSKLKDKNLINRFRPEFNPDFGNFMNCFVKSRNLQNNDFKLEHLEFVIFDLLKENTFLYSNKFIFSRNSEQLNNEKILLQNLSREEIRTYYQLKELWKYKTGEMSDFLFLLERKKRVYINLENKYLKHFGDLEYKKIRWNNQLEKYSEAMKFLKEKPWLTFRELIAIVNEKIQNNFKKQNELKNKINRSNALLDLSYFPGAQSPVTAEFKNMYADECKKLLKKLFFLLHTDTCPGYSALSENKKKKINNLWLKLLDTTQNEIFSYSPTMLLYHYPDIDILDGIYIKACKILDISPNHAEQGDRLEFLIKKGTSYPKVMEFLSEEIEKMDLHLANIELVQDEYTHESESQYYRSALENTNGHSEKLSNELKDLKQEVVKIKKEISKRLIKEKV